MRNHLPHDGWKDLGGKSKGWSTFCYEGWHACVPENDVQEHWEDNLACPCRPRWNAKTRVLLHFAFDGRDLIERLEAGEKIA